MTDPRRQFFAPYARQLADLMALKDWKVEIGNNAAPPDALASYRITYGRKFVFIGLGDSFLDETPEEQRHALVHELIHCHFNAPWTVADQSSTKETERAVHFLMEHAVDALADAFAKFLPLPPKAEPIQTPPPS